MQSLQTRLSVSRIGNDRPLRLSVTTASKSWTTRVDGRRQRARIRLLPTQATQELQNWLDSATEAAAKVSLTAEGDSCLLVASEALKAGETIFNFKQENWISLETVAASPIGAYVQNLEPWLQLTLFLLTEKSNQDSPWRSYIDQLPEMLSSPAFWTDAELQSIQGTQLHESALGYRRFFRQKHETLRSELFLRHPDIFGDDRFDYGAFSWATGVVRSQTYPPMEGERLALIPLLSHMRHARYPNVQLKLNTGNLFNPVATLSVVTVRTVKKGETLTMDYGSEKSDSQIVLDYGIVDTENPQGGYSLSLQLPDGDPNIDDKLDILDISGMQQPIVFDFLPNQDPPEGLLFFLRLLNLSGPDAFHLEALFRNEVQDHLRFPISEENESNCCDTMLAGCSEALKAYDSISSSNPRSKEEIIKMVCYGEQQTLEWLQLWFQRRKERLKELEYYAERRLKRLGLLDDGPFNSSDSF